jgi:hypothetical protein
MPVICVVKFYKNVTKINFKTSLFKEQTNLEITSPLFSKEEKMNFTEISSPFKARSN